ncbi:MAG TPA: chemotaxis protein CheW [Verrucomicrobiae bacterium]
MSELKNQMVVFRLGDQRYALMLAAVERIVRAVEVIPLPRSPAIVMGVINVEGRILPVLNVRARVGQPNKEITPDDHFLIARTERREVVLVIDEPEGVIESAAADITDPDGIVPGVDQLKGVIKFDDGLVLIYDLEKFLSADEEAALGDAMEKEAAHGR